MDKDKIYKLAIASGFKLKQAADGTMDIDPCVYAFADKLLAQHDMTGLDLIQRIRQAVGDQEGKLMQDELVAHISKLKGREERYDEVVDKPLECGVQMRKALELSRRAIVHSGLRLPLVIEEIDKALSSEGERN